MTPPAFSSYLRRTRASADLRLGGRRPSGYGGQARKTRLRVKLRRGMPVITTQTALMRLMRRGPVHGKYAMSPSNKVNLKHEVFVMKPAIISSTTRILILFCIFTIFLCPSCVSQEIKDARIRLRKECNDPTCTVGMGTCYQDPKADLIVCLCDHGCRVME